MTEREQDHAELIAAGNSALEGSRNAGELWERYERLKHAFARKHGFFPELPQTNQPNES